ncbi:MAG TPA: transketolase [Pseudonocardiaceae bacterium]|jgi:transketolase|nr:transketolase [Pseudonocardiaceae bacterium]
MTTAAQVQTEELSTTMRDTFAQVVNEALDADPRLALVLADISASMLTGAKERHPDRVINVGIREQAMIGVAGGLALTGLRPIVHSFPSFLVERPFEQLKLDLGHQGVGAVLVSAGASYDMAAAGRTHQSPADVTLVDTLPGWTIYLPGHPAEAERLLYKAFTGEDRVYVRLSGQANRQPYALDGSDRLTILRTGRRGLVLAVGPVADRVLAATEQLDVTVAYTATARPLDGAGLRAAALAADQPDVVLVEPYLAGTSAYLVNAALDNVPHRVRSLGVGRETEVRMYGSADDHDAVHGLDAAGIHASIVSFLR